MSYQCPLCCQVLKCNQKQWLCCNNHQFDCAREGYVNLMSVQHKRSMQPGDNLAMIQARRAFLDGGYYQPLKQRVITLLDDILPDGRLTLLDIGCGEGYYTASVADELNQKREVKVYGLDVAKVAIRYAAKRYQNVIFCVASSHRLPFDIASLDAVLRIYAPCKSEELVRVVRSGGIVMTVTPGPRHLYQLKRLIYPQVQLHSVSGEKLEGFNLLASHSLGYGLKLSGEQGVNLLQMTPFAWRASISTRQKITVMREFECETDFVIRIYQKNA